jgi:hypothetical protein
MAEAMPYPKPFMRPVPLGLRWPLIFKRREIASTLWLGRGVVFEPSRFLGIAESGTRVVIAERNQLSIGGDILNDTALEAAQIVTARVHEVHARHEYAVEALVKPASGPSLRLVLPPFDAAQHTLECESGRGLPLIETLRQSRELADARNLPLYDAPAGIRSHLSHTAKEAVKVEEAAKASWLVVVVNKEERAKRTMSIADRGNRRIAADAVEGTADQG